MNKIQIEKTEHGHNFIKFYEVRAIDHEATTITIERFLNEDEANEYVKFVEDNYKNLYAGVWTREQIIWC